MATRDEIVRFVYKVTGSEELADASLAMLDAAKAGGQSAEQIEALGAAWRKVAQDVADTSALQSAVDTFGDLAKKQDEVADAAEAAGLKLRLYSESEAAAAAALREKNEALAAAKAAQKDYAGTADKLVLVERELSAAVKDAAAEQKSANAEWKDSVAGLKEATRGYEKAATAQEKLGGDLAELGRQIEGAGLSTADLGAAQVELSKRSDEAARRIAELGKQMQRGGTFATALKSAAEAGAKGFASLRESVNGFGSSLLRITGIAGLVTTALGAFSGARIFGGAVKSAREFGEALSEVQAVSGASAEQLQKMRDVAEDVASATKFSATEAAKGLGELARATGDAESAMAALPATMQLAQAAGYGVAESATLITTTLTQFGLAAAEAGRVSDVLAMAANATNADVEGLGNALSYAAPLARQLGLNLEETTAVIGAMADEGFRGERAGTALRNAFSAMLDPSSKFKQALIGIGIETNNFGEVIEGLARAGDRGRDAIMQLDSAARPSILALVSSGGAAIRSLKADLDAAAGSAAETAKVMGDNFAGASSRLGNALDSLRRALIDPILEPLKTEFDDLAKKVREFMTTADFTNIKLAVGDFARSGAAAMREFAGSIDFSAMAKSLRDFTAEARTWFTALKDNATAASTTLRATGNTIAIVWNSMQTVVLGAATAITGALKLLVDGWVRTFDSLSGLPVIGGKITEMVNELKMASGGLGAVTEEFWTRTKQNAKETGDALSRLSENISSTGEATKVAASSFDELAKRAGLTSEQLRYFVDNIDELPEGLRSIVEPALKAAGLLQDVGSAGQEAADGTARVAEELQAAEQRLLDAVDAFERLKNASGATADQLALARAEVIAAKDALRKLDTSADDATAKLEQLKNAFKTLNLTTQAELNAAAATAKSAFAKIQEAASDGIAAQEDLSRAFRAMAEAQLAAAADSSDAVRQQVEAQIRAQATALGLAADLKQLGLEGKDAGDKTADSFDRAARSIGGAASAADDLAKAAKGAAGGTTALGQAAQQAAQSVQEAGAGLGYMTDRAREAITAVSPIGPMFGQRLSTAMAAYRSEIFATREELEAFIRTQKESAEAALDAAAKLKDMTEQMRDARDAAEGNADAIEQRRYEKELARIRELSDLAGYEGAKQAAEARSLAEEQHRRNMQSIKDEAAAREAERRAAKAAEASRSDSQNAGGGGSSASTRQQDTSRPAGGMTLAPVINFNGGGIDLNNPADRRHAAQKMGREMRAVLEEIGRLRR